MASVANLYYKPHGIESFPTTSTKKTTTTRKKAEASVVHDAGEYD